MPKQYSYTSVLRVFSKIERDFGITTFNEFDVIEWIGEALEAIGSINQYEEAIAFIEVKNHQCYLPKGLNSIIQIAKNRCWDGISKGICAEQVVKTTCTANVIPQGQSPVLVDSCNVPVPLCPKTPVLIDCHGTPITDYEVAYYRPFFDLNAFYFNWCNSELYKSCFYPVRLANHTFFNSLVCQETSEDIKKLYHTTRDEYTVINKEILRFSFQEGQVALAYTRQKLDIETGYPMIPDIKSVIDAVCFYIQWKMQSKEYYMAREGAEGRMNTAKKQWIWYCKQAGGELTQPFGIDDYQDILDMMKYLVPQKDRYFGFFGNLTRPENTLIYDDPDHRNGYRDGIGYFRGYNQ